MNLINNLPQVTVVKKVKVLNKTITVFIVGQVARTQILITIMISCMSISRYLKVD